MELIDFYPKISEKKIPLAILDIKPRLYVAWKEAKIINTVIADNHNLIERKTERKWVYLDVFNALWLLIVKEMRKINIDFQTIRELKEEMFGLSTYEKNIEKITNEEFESLLLDYYPAETIKEFGANFNKQYFIDTIKDNLAEETSLYLSEMSILLFSALVLKKSPSIIIFPGAVTGDCFLVTIKNNPSTPIEKEELYNFYTEKFSTDTFINIPIVPLLTKLFENEKMESYLYNFGLFSNEESRILENFRNNQCKEITIVKHESGNVCINTTTEKNIKDEEAKKLRTILGLKEYSRAEVIFRNGKHMVVKNTIKEIIEKQ
jgi:hypothetical protein